MKNNPLRYLVLLCIFTLSLAEVRAQYVSIPDPNFATWLHTHGYDSCMTGNLLDTVCSRSFEQPTNDLDLSGLGISDLTGINYISWCAPNGGCVIKSINLAHNNFSHFPAELFPRFNNYFTVDISYNHIDTLTIGPNYFGLAILYASHNGMHVFQKDTAFSNFTIRGLDLNYNNLSSFPSSFNSNGSSGYGLQIRHNYLTAVPTGNYFSLDCGANQITSIAGMNSVAATLIIDSNLLTSLNLAGVGTYWHVMYTLDCSHNQITSITNIQFTSMSANYNTGKFICNDNNLTQVPHIPTDTRVLDCHNNPNLQCIANLPNVPAFNLNYTNTDIHCLPRQFPNCVYTSTPSINSVPTCDMYNNIYGCPQYSNLEGYAYTDLDSNCINDPTDLKLGYFKAKFLHNGNLGQQTYTDWTGHYSFDEMNYGTYTIELDTTLAPVKIFCPDTAYYTAKIDSQQLYQTGFDFGLRCKNGFDVGDLGLATGAFLPHAYSDVNFSAGDISQLYGLHCATGVSGQIRFTYSGPLTYVSNSGTLQPTSVNGNTIIWDIADFGSFNINTAFNLRFYVDSTAHLHDNICFNVQVTPVAGDLNPANNSFSYCDEVLVAYDPNIKTVYPAGDIPDTTQWLLYTIRFQNTGTAPAQHVQLVDTLDSHLDLSSFELLKFSHPNITQISEDGIVKFNFPNINLPDSNANDTASHGYVQYRMRLKEGLTPGTQIQNTAYIYFDFNTPVVTNTTLNTISTISGIKTSAGGEAEFSLYPNPAANSVAILLGKTYLGSTLAITDITGRNILTLKPEIMSTRLETTSMNNGVYFFTLFTSDHRHTTRRLVISK